MPTLKNNKPNQKIAALNNLYHETAARLSEIHYQKMGLIKVSIKNQDAQKLAEAQKALASEF